jgi:hypothetical protein
MADQGFEADVRQQLARLLDGLSPPSPRWIGSPSARRIAGGEGHRRRLPMVVAMATCAAGLLLAAIVVLPALVRGPAATQLATPSPVVSPVASPTASATSAPTATSATPTAQRWPSPGELGGNGWGEMRLGAVTPWPVDGESPLYVRVTPVVAGYRIDFLVVGQLTERIGSERLRILREGAIEPTTFATSADPLAVDPATPIGTERSRTIAIALTPGQNMDIAFLDASGTVVFSYPIQRIPPRSLEAVGWDGSTAEPAPAAPEPSLPSGATEVGRRVSYQQVLWSPDGRWFAADGSRHGQMSEGSDLQPVVDVYTADGTSVASYDATFMAWVDTDHLAVGDPWVVGEPGVGVRVVSLVDGSEVRVRGSYDALLGDGRGTLYLSSRDPAGLDAAEDLAIWRAGKITRLGQVGRPQALTPDGSVLVLSGRIISENTISSWELVLLRTRDHARLPTPDQPGGLFGPTAVSPDGRWLAANLDVIEIGTRRLVRAPALPAAQATGSLVGWTPDGRIVIEWWQDAARSRYFAWTLGGGTEELTLAGRPSYAPTGGGLATLQTSKATTPVAIVSRGGSSVTVPLAVRYADDVAAWSPDGTRCIVGTGLWDSNHDDRLVLVTP